MRLLDFALDTIAGTCRGALVVARILLVGAVVLTVTSVGIGAPFVLASLSAWWLLTLPLFWLGVAMFWNVATAPGGHVADWIEDVIGL